MTRSTLLPFLVLVSTPTLPAALQAPLPQYQAYWSIPGSLPFTRAEDGRFVPFSGRSVAYLWGGDIALACAPITHSITSLIWPPSLESPPVPGSVTSFVVWPGAEEAGQDALLVADDNGLSRVQYEDTDTSPRFVWTLVVPSGVGAHDLAMLDLEADGDLDIVLIRALGAGGQIEVLRNDAGVFTSLAVYSSLGQATDIEPIYWDSDLIPELAVCSSFGTEVLSTDGTPLWWRWAPSSGVHCMAVVAPPASAIPRTEESLAIVQPNPAGTNQTLTLFNVLGNNPPISLGTTQVVGLDAGDYDGDGHEDLALAQFSGAFVRLLHSDNGIFSNAPAKRVDVCLGADVGNSQAEVILADLDDDGIADVCAPGRDAPGTEATVWITAVSGSNVGSSCLGSAAATGFPLNSSPGTFQLYHVWGDIPSRPTYSSSGTGPSPWPAGEAGIELQLANEWIGQLTPTSPHTDLEVVIWGPEEDDEDEVHYIAVRHGLYSISGPGFDAFRNGTDTVEVGFSIRKGNIDPLTGPGGTGTVNLFDTERYYVEVRPVKLTAAGKLTQALTVRCGGFTYIDPGQPATHNALDELLDNDGVTEGEIAMSVTQAGSSLLFLSEVGGFVPQPRIPPKRRANVLPIIEAPRKSIAVAGSSN